MRPGDTPAVIETGDTTDYELGTKIEASQNGWITSLSYFRGLADAGDTDVRTLNLWTGTGERLGQVAVTSAPGATGWQAGTLDAPVAISGGATYVISYGTTQNYAFTRDYFATERSGPDGVLAGLASGASGGNGVFAPGSPGAFPTASFNASNYWVDVTFEPGGSGAVNQPPVITSSASITSPENRLVAGTVIATDPNGDALTYALSGGADAGLFSIDAATGALSFVAAPDYEAPADADGDNVYEVGVSVSDGIAPAVSQALAVSVSNLNDTSGVFSLFAPGDTPAVIETGDTTDYELGTKIEASQNGWITSLSYFRGLADAGDTDVRTLNLWTGTGERLGQVTVTSAPGATGWQAGTLDAPVAISGGATYVISYGTTQNYAFTRDYFATERSGPDGVLAGLASGASGGNGVFAPGSPGAFPTASFNASNYWVDVTFEPGGSAPAATFASAAQTIAGTSSAGALTGGNGSDLIAGLDGDDTLIGNGGDDRIEGWGGDDTLTGGEGDDVFVFAAGASRGRESHRRFRRGGRRRDRVCRLRPGGRPGGRDALQRRGRAHRLLGPRRGWNGASGQRRVALVHGRGFPLRLTDGGGNADS